MKLLLVYQNKSTTFTSEPINYKDMKYKKNGAPKKSGGSRNGSGQPQKNTFLYRKMIDARIEVDFRIKAKELIVELLNKKNNEI